jgi:hypothetical protein
MVYKTRRCKVCDIGGAYHFNNLCPRHWDELIDKNVKKLILEIKKKEPF